MDSNTLPKAKVSRYALSPWSEGVQLLHGLLGFNGVISDDAFLRSYLGWRASIYNGWQTVRKAEGTKVANNVFRF